MNLQSKILAAVSDEQLLRELLTRNGPNRGPSSSYHASTIRESIIGIGKDHVATILIHSEDLEELGIRDTIE